MVKNVIFTSKYKRDYKLLFKQGRDMSKLDDVVERLVYGKELGAKFKDHALRHNWQGCRDCHIEHDWILIYETSPNTLILHRTGTHARLFNM